ncbi:MAG: hypothetical protein M3299_01490 [Thermoproteota archaeon]|nr:hypothetical protein [Thermoproteota archaeon]
MTMRKPTKTMAMITIDMLALTAAVIPLTAVEPQTGAAAAAAAVPAETITSTTTIGNNTNGTTSTGISLSQQPVLQERTRTASETQINYAHVSITYTGNGTLNLPNNNIAPIANFTTNGSALVSFLTQSAQGTETIRTGNGETATITFYEIVKFNPATREAKGIIIAEVQASPTGTLASLNDMILAGIDDVQLNGESSVTLWEWESGISNLDIFPVQDELRIQ